MVDALTDTEEIHDLDVLEGELQESLRFESQVA